MEKGLIQDLRSLHTNKDKFTNWMEQSHLKPKSLANSKHQELENVRSSLKTLETDNQKLLNRYMTSEGAALQSWMNEQISTLNERKQQLEKFEQQLLEDISIFEKSKFDSTAISKILAQVFQVWDQLEAQKQKALLRGLLNRVIISENNQVTYTWNPNLEGVTILFPQLAFGKKWRGGRDSNPRPSA